MRYQNDLLAKQHDDLRKKFISACNSSDYTATRISEGDLSTFEEAFLGETMVFTDNLEELSMLLPIVKDKFKKLGEPADFYFESGKLRRPAHLNDEEKNIVINVLTPRMGGFTGRTRVYNWSSVDVHNLAANKVSVSIERYYKKVA